MAKAKSKKKPLKIVKPKQKKSAAKKAVAIPKPKKMKAQVVAKKVAKKSIPKIKFADVTDFVTPLDDRMIIQVSVGEKMTPGGLYIPDTVTSVAGHREGTVIAVGRGHRDAKGRVRPMDVKMGDKVLFSDFTGSKLNYQGQDLIILRETDVMGVLD